MSPGAAAIWEAVGIDPVTKRALNPEPPRDPPGPIAVCIEPWQPCFDEFVRRAEEIVGADLVELVATDLGGRVPAGCFGAIGLDMWECQIECVRRGIDVYMLETLRSVESEGIDVERSLPGHVGIGDGDWRPLLDEYAQRLVFLRDEFVQRDIKSMLAPGDTGKPTVWSRRFAGDDGRTYTFARVLGLGGTAIVALVSDESGREYAAKALSAHRLPVARRREWFEREGRILASFDHPNILCVEGQATMRDDEPVLMLEYLPQGSLFTHLARSGPPDPETAVAWLRDALAGLAEMHGAGVVHRDVSVKNLLFRDRGEVVVSDFGTARHVDDATLTAARDRIGSLIYMAPEQFQSPHEAGCQADVYAIGQVGFQLLTGLVPLGKTGPAHVHNPEVPALLSETIEMMRAYRPDDRPADAAVALGLLKKF